MRVFLHFSFYGLCLCGLGLVSPLSLRIAPLDILQVNYEPYLRPGFYGLPTLDLKSLNFSDIVNKTHTAITLENEHIRVVILPEIAIVIAKPVHFLRRRCCSVARRQASPLARRGAGGTQNRRRSRRGCARAAWLDVPLGR